MLTSVVIQGSLLAGERSWQTCVNCGKNKEFLDPDKPEVNGWSKIESYYSNVNGFYCPQSSCQMARQKAAAEAFKRYQEEMRQIEQSAQSRKNGREMVNKFSSELAKQLQVCTSADQIKLMQTLTAKFNAQKFWETFAAFGSMEAIRHYWPEPSDEKIYLSSKMQMEKNKQTSEAEQQARQQGNFFSQVKNMRKDALVNIAGGGEIAMAVKQTPAAFALGRSKKDQSVRYVDSVDFSEAVLNAAFANNRSDVVAYLAKQCGGLPPELQKNLFANWVKHQSAAQKQLFQLKKSLVNAEKTLTTADDQYDQEKIQKTIKALNTEIASREKSPDYEASLKIIFSDMSPDTAAELYFFTPQMIKDHLGADDFSMQLQAAAAIQMATAKNQSELPAIQKLGEIKSQQLSNAERETLANELTARIRQKCQEVMSQSAGDLGAWARWHVELKKHWKANVPDPWLRAIVTEKEAGVWLWYPDIPSLYQPGFVSGESAFTWRWRNDIPHASHPGYVSSQQEMEWIWKPGTKNLVQPGYCADQAEGKFVWKPGLPNVKIVGLISGTKEGEWKTAPGFVKKGDKVIWQSGHSHPRHPGLISAEQIFTWRPDSEHLWQNPRSADLKVEEDRQILRSEAQKGAEIGVKVLQRL